MTTDLDLRDLLSAEAAGPPRPAPGWNDIVRRGRHRQRVRRTRSTLGGLAVALAVVGFVLADRDQGVDTTPPATEPTAPTPTTSPLDYTPDPPNTDVLVARTEGAFITLIFPSIDGVTGVPTSVEPCRYHPLVVESPDQVLVDVVDDTVEGGTAWARCQDGGSTGTIELAEPLGDRTLVNARSGDIVSDVAVVDSATLLFPTTLPDRFDLERWDEGSADFATGRTWAFSWSAGDERLSVSTGDVFSSDCEAHTVEVRGTSGRLCAEDVDGMRVDLQWEEGGQPISISGNFGASSEADAVAEVLAVAEGLEPLGG